MTTQPDTDAMRKSAGEKLLKACPFCGDQPKLFIPDYSTWDAYVFCTGCGAEGPKFNDRSKKKKAVAGWNKRAERTVLTDEDRALITELKSHFEEYNRPHITDIAVPVEMLRRTLAIITKLAKWAEEREMISTTAATERQRDVFDFIVAFVGERGHSPTVREIGSYFGIASPNGVMCHLKALEKKGLITRERNLGRNIVVNLGACKTCPMCQQNLKNPKD